MAERRSGRTAAAMVLVCTAGLVAGCGADGGKRGRTPDAASPSATSPEASPTPTASASATP